MRRRRSTSARRRLIVVGLFALSILALIVHGAWGGRPLSLLQVLIPFQDAVTTSMNGVGDWVAGDGGATASDPATARALQQENEALRRQVAALTVRMRDVLEENAVLTAIRLHTVDGARLGVRGSLIPADVVAGDVLPWRASAWINSGKLSGVRSGAAVTSASFTLDQGREQGIVPGLAVLLSEVMVGTVVNAGTHSARVRLLGDPEARLRVRLGRFRDGSFHTADAVFWLRGSGDGAMRIRDVPLGDVNAGHYAVGDTVLVDPDAGAAPAALTVGTVSAIEPDRENPLLTILEVRSPVDLDRLRRVYVFDPTPSEP